MQNGLFDVEFRMDELSKNGDPLEKFNKYVPWEEFRSKLEVIRKNETVMLVGVHHLMSF